MLPGGLQVRIKSPSAGNEGAVVSSWTLPAYGVSMPSGSIQMAIGKDPVVMRSRIAEALGIRSGQTVEFEIVSAPGLSLEAPVTIKDNLQSDLLLHGLVHLLPGNCRLESDASCERIYTAEGKLIEVAMQNMWAGMRIVPRNTGTALLHVDGASRNNPQGPTGYGFRITIGPRNNGDEMVRGYGYGGMSRSNNEMEYEALIEGLIWAGRLSCKRLLVYSDSELVVRQVSGEYQVRDEKLQSLHAKALTLVQKIKGDTEFNISHIPRDQNLVADCLANLGIDTRENVTACNWNNVNRFIGGQ